MESQSFQCQQFVYIAIQNLACSFYGGHIVQDMFAVQAPGKGFNECRFIRID